MDISYHFPPELLEILVETIPVLGRAKEFPLVFFRGAGVSESMLADWRTQLTTNRHLINKYQISRSVLTRLSEGHDATLAQRREVIKRVVEFENFTACWDNERLKAQGLVAQVRSLVNVKDSFTRMNLEREKELAAHRKQYEAEMRLKGERDQQREVLKAELYSLFAMSDAHKRGKALESVLNRMFAHYSMLVKEAFTVRGIGSEGVIEQIDGLVELDSHLHFVEMKWWNKPIGFQEVAQHLVRVFSRAEARCIFISASPYTEPAVAQFRLALQQKVCIMCSLEEIVKVVDGGKDLRELFRKKIQAAVAHRNPWYECINEI
jgi:restriction system protein